VSPSYFIEAWDWHYQIANRGGVATDSHLQQRLYDSVDGGSQLSRSQTANQIMKGAAGHNSLQAHRLQLNI